MTNLRKTNFSASAPEEIATMTGRIGCFVTPDGAMDSLSRKLNTLSRGAIKRLVASKAFTKLDEGKGLSLQAPHGLQADAVMVVKLAKSADQQTARLAGASLAGFQGDLDLTVLAGGARKSGDVLLGLLLKAYNFNAHKTGEAAQTPDVSTTFMVNDPAALEAEAAVAGAVAEGVFFTRDLVNEPSNILTTVEFAARLEAMRDLGLMVTTLDEPELERLGMGALLGVGMGSETPSKVVIMEWNGGGDENPFALVGKGVVFDTGGISLKPAGGMEDMTMDMGGAGVVSGVMRTLARRKAKANVVGIVGLVENMPDGRAQRPGDVVTSMKGDTIEVINTDAEGRLVLADILWYVQEKYQPVGMINLATLTGAMVIALGHDNAGVFSNDDKLANAFLKAADAENEGAWRLPMGKSYDKLIKSRIADMKNVGGRPAGAITAAQFLKRFVKDETPWCHLDIAGVALLKTESDLAPKGATGWGVMALDRLIRDRFEG